jgi:hypothetical protein
MDAKSRKSTGEACRYFVSADLQDSTINPSTQARDAEGDNTGDECDQTQGYSITAEYGQPISECIDTDTDGKAKLL